MNIVEILKSLKTQGFKITGVGNNELIIEYQGSTKRFDMITGQITEYVWGFI